VRWNKRKQTDKYGRSGWSYFSDDGNWEISDEGPKPWTLLRRNIVGDFTHYAEFKTLPEAKRAALRGTRAELSLEGN